MKAHSKWGWYTNGHKLIAQKWLDLLLPGQWARCCCWGPAGQPFSAQTHSCQCFIWPARQGELGKRDHREKALILDRKQSHWECWTNEILVEKYCSVRECVHKATLRTSCGENEWMQRKKQAPGSDQESQEGRVRHEDQRQISSHWPRWYRSPAVH